MKNQEFYFCVFDKEDTYTEDECLTNFDTEDEARNYCLSENAAYGYTKLYYSEVLYSNE